MSAGLSTLDMQGLTGAHVIKAKGAQPYRLAYAFCESPLMLAFLSFTRPQERSHSFWAAARRLCVPATAQSLSACKATGPDGFRERQQMSDRQQISEARRATGQARSAQTIPGAARRRLELFQAPPQAGVSCFRTRALSSASGGEERGCSPTLSSYLPSRVVKLRVAQPLASESKLT